MPDDLSLGVRGERHRAGAVDRVWDHVLSRVEGTWAIADPWVAPSAVATRTSRIAWTWPDPGWRRPEG